jgi:outer membrane protein OmpA-like peptidoglycan-associated protein
MPRWKKTSLIVAGIILLLAAFNAFVLPVIVKNQVVQRVEVATGRTLEIGRISFNPFTLTVVIDDFRFTERGSGETFAAFSSARIAMSPLSLYRRTLIVASARITSPHFRIVRIGTNNYNFSDLRKWLPLHPRLSVNNLTMTNGSIDFIDQGHPVEQRQELRKIELAVPFITTMAYYSDRFIAPRLSAELNGTPLHVEGKLRPFPRAVEAEGTITVQGLSLPDILPYLPATLPLQIESGRLSGQIAVTYRAAPPEKPELMLDGSVILADLKFADRKGISLLTVAQLDVVGNLAFGGSAGTRLEVADLTLRDGDLQFSRDRQGTILPLTWDLLQLDQLKWSFAPFTLDIGQVALSRFSSEIVVAPDGSLNLAQLFLAGKEQKVTAKGKGRMIRIKTVTIQDGTLIFSDHHVPGGYRTTLYNLGGRINGLSSESDRFADVDLHGSLEKRSPLTITGQINPLRDDLFVDLKGSFDAIELAPLTPYAVTYLGYAIDQGQLFFNSDYRIKERKLDLENKLRIVQLDFGQRIESEKAISSAVQLAVALLKDRQGEIYLDLPVTGRTDDPHFSISHLVFEMVQNLFTKAEEAPFSLLPSLSSVQEDWSSVGFAPGSAELFPGEQEKLLKLATALNDRPALKIKVVGLVDRVGADVGLQNLAEDRAAGVRAFLVEQGGMDGARLLLESGEIDRTPGKGGEIGSRVVFKVVVDN